jgi:hypothetical protein
MMSSRNVRFLGSGRLWLIMASSVVLGGLSPLAHAQSPDEARHNADLEDIPGVYETKNAGNPVVENSINVLKIQNYDRRFLLQLLQQEERELGHVGSIDGATIASGIGKFQGINSSSTSLGFSLLGPPTPQTVTKNIVTSGSTTSTTNETDTTTNSQIPTTPTPSSSPAATGLQTISPSAVSLLADEISLRSQVSNLQMLLRGSLNDTLYSDHSFGEARRLNGVLGFDISIMPTKEQIYAVAVVEVTLVNNSIRPSQPPPHIVALMPEQNSYNVVGLVNTSSSIGLGAILGAFSAGMSGSSSHQSMNLVVDRDIIGQVLLQPSIKWRQSETSQTPEKKPQSDDGQRGATFAWQFRPVLGRKIVDPGIRHLFAVVSLPNPDEAQSTNGYYGTAHIRTYWRSYDAKTGAVGAEIPGSSRSQMSQKIDIQTSSEIMKATKPRIDVVHWTDTGNGNVIVEASGSGINDETQVFAGSTIFTSDAGGGLVVNPDNSVRFAMSASNLVRWPNPKIVGDFGAEGFLNDPTIGSSTEPTGIELKQVNVARYDSDHVEVTLYLVDRKIPNKIPAMFHPLVAIGSHVYGTEDSPFIATPELHKGISAPEQTIGVIVPTVDALAARHVRVVDPFYGERYILDADFAFPSGFLVADDIQLIGGSGDGSDFLMNGEGFASGPAGVATSIQLVSGSVTPVIINPRLLRFHLTAAQIKENKVVFVQNTASDPVLVNLPAATPSAPPSSPPPSVTGADIVYQGDSKTIALTGVNLDSVNGVKFEDTELTGVVAKPISLKFRVTSAVTRTAGDHELTLSVKNGDPISYTLVVKPRP